MVILYDSAEETRKGENEKLTLKQLFKKVYSQEVRLPVGDFLFALNNMDNPDISYVYPLIIERKREDDLMDSMVDGRYTEQKQRIKRSLPRFHHVYLVENYEVHQCVKNDVFQAKVDTESIDEFLVYETQPGNYRKAGKPDNAQTLEQWTFMIYHSIQTKVQQLSDQSDFFENEGYILWQEFISSDKFKKTNARDISAKKQFQLMLMRSIPDVDETVAALITATYPTLRHLWNAWNHCDNVKDKESMLYNLEGNEWIKCRIDGHYTTDVDDCVLAELDRIGERPINEALSADMYRLLAT